MKNRLVADLGKALAVLILIIILLMPTFTGSMNISWWRINLKSHNGSENKTAEFCITGNTSMENAGLFKIYSQDDIVDYEDENFKKTSEVFSFIRMILLIGLIITIISMIFIGIACKNKIPVKIPMIVVLITFIILLIAPLYFLFQIPKAYNEDLKENTDNLVDITFFIGTNPINDTSESEVKPIDDTPTSWFPYLGFFIALNASMINISIFNGMRKNKRSYTYIPKDRGDLLYQQKQNHLVDDLVTNIPPPQQPIQPEQPIPTQQPPTPQLPDGMIEFESVVEEEIDEQRIEEIHKQRLKMLNELKAEADLEVMLDDYNNTKTKMEEEEEAYERELSLLASKKQFDISEIVNIGKEKQKKSYCPKCNGELEKQDGIIICLNCGSKYKQKK